MRLRPKSADAAASTCSADGTPVVTLVFARWPEPTRRRSKQRAALFKAAVPGPRLASKTALAAPARINTALRGPMIVADRSYTVLPAPAAAPSRERLGGRLGADFNAQPSAIIQALIQRRNAGWRAHPFRSDPLGAAPPASAGRGPPRHQAREHHAQRGRRSLSDRLQPVGGGASRRQHAEDHLGDGAYKSVYGLLATISGARSGRAGLRAAPARTTCSRPMCGASVSSSSPCLPASSSSDRGSTPADNLFPVGVVPAAAAQEGSTPRSDGELSLPVHRGRCPSSTITGVAQDPARRDNPQWPVRTAGRLQRQR